MIRLAPTLLWAVLASVAGSGLFLLKSQVQSQEAKLAALQHDIAAAHTSIHVLNAEWSYLNDPERLRRESESLLGMRPIEPDQIVAIDSLPMATAQDSEALAAKDNPKGAPKNAKVAALPGQSPQRRLRR